PGTTSSAIHDIRTIDMAALRASGAPGAQPYAFRALALLRAARRPTSASLAVKGSPPPDAADPARRAGVRRSRALAWSHEASTLGPVRAPDRVSSTGDGRACG